ncbi:MAG: hypothetical protein ACKPKO_30515, partial [Candidatus Fonsibacter sp.]
MNKRYEEVHINIIKPREQIDIACRLASRVAWMENEPDLKAVLLLPCNGKKQYHGFIPTDHL